MYNISGILMVLCLGIAFSRETKHAIRNWSTLMAIIAAVHYYTAGLHTAAGANIIAIIATWTLGSRDNETKVSVWVLLGFAMATVILILGTWAGPQSLLPGVAQLLGLVTIWFKTPKVVIATRLCVEPLWIWYNILGSAFYGLAASIAMLSGGIFRIVRLNQIKKLHQQNLK